MTAESGAYVDDECIAVLEAERVRHRDWHVCHNADNAGMTDYCADDDETGMEPCPLYRALAHALFAMRPSPDSGTSP